MATKKSKNRSQPKPLKGLTHEQLDEALRHVLTSTLAIYVLNKTTIPISKAVKDLSEIQMNAAQLVGFLLNLQSKKTSPVDLRHTLAGVFSFIPIKYPKVPRPAGYTRSGAKRFKAKSPDKSRAPTEEEIF